MAERLLTADQMATYIDLAKALVRAVAVQPMHGDLPLAHYLGEARDALEGAERELFAEAGEGIAS